MDNIKKLRTCYYRILRYILKSNWYCKFVASTCGLVAACLFISAAHTADTILMVYI